jgi:hypothetical protein
MDAECAFCGRSLSDERRRLYCEDCQATHTICSPCVAEVETEPEAYRLVA